jgi:hypothetical protein
MKNNRLRRSTLSELLDEFRTYNKIIGIAEIARRYFAMNAFDGVLTTIGVLAGNYLAGVRDLSIPIRTGIATSIFFSVLAVAPSKTIAPLDSSRGDLPPGLSR